MYAMFVTQTHALYVTVRHLLLLVETFLTDIPPQIVSTSKEIFRIFWGRGLVHPSTPTFFKKFTPACDY